jgi:hypothetical protein
MRRSPRNSASFRRSGVDVLESGTQTPAATMRPALRA